ncbi:unnamed protein product [Bursaphelenchus okinawaensis]|uniref:LRRCT domain-containing protein n=1 Tax=Bursaphelenchus okinawaensis TaxID=465554 RepID=A0A811JTS1_9BILA|nr:unnamed protein product [Bursaphelenchus okinawaensis]CAG9083040.1 unnamed protein product [Bursaphelenchus okinawaensis]
MKPLALLWLVPFFLVPVRSTVLDCPSQCSCDDKVVTCQDVDPATLNVLFDEIVSIQDGAELDKLVITRCSSAIKEFNVKLPSALKVKSLELSGCGIQKIGNGVFDKLNGLEELLLPNNNFQVIPLLGKLNKLKTLNFNRNKLNLITEGSFSGLDELTHLRLKHNNISSFPATSLLELKTHLVLLDLSHNALANVPVQNIRNSQRLTYLDLSHNHITSIEQMEFVNLVKLKELRLNGNNLANLNPRAFLNVPSVTHLNLQDNKLSEVLMLNAFEHLEVVNISNNAIKKIPPFKDMTNLRQVMLHGNKIQKIETMTFSSCPELKVIDLRMNEISVISRNSFDALPNINNVLLSNNKLTSIPKGMFDGLTALHQISLGNNTITEINKDSFTAIPEITAITLDGNKIHNIPKETFTSNTKLFWLNLADNGLESIEEGALPPSVANILLNGNRLNCDAKFDWFIKYLVSNNVRTFLPDQPEVTCNSPPEYYGTRLKDLMIQKANRTLTESMKHLGFDQNSQAKNDLLNRILPALGNMGAGAGGDASPVLNSLSQAIPALRNIPGLSMLPAPENSNPASRNLDSAVEQFAEPLVRLAAGGQAVPSDINSFIKSIPNLVVNIPGVGDVDISKLPPSLIEHVLKGGQIPGVPKETLQGVVKQYMQRVYAAAAQAQGKPLDESVVQDIPNVANLDKDKYLKPLNELPAQFVTNVMKGDPLPYLTPSQTDVIKGFYTQGMTVENPVNGSGNSLQGMNPNTLNMLKLLPPGYDWSKLPPSVTKAVMRGEMPNLSDLPKDLQDHIRENLDSLIKSMGNTPELSIDEIMKKLPNFTRVEQETFAPYDINKIDADLVVKDTLDVETMRFYIAIALGLVCAVTVVVLALFCWYGRQQRMEERIVQPHLGPLGSSTPRRPKLSFDEEDDLERGVPPFPEPHPHLSTSRSSRLNDSAVYQRHNISSSHQYV